jgi:hypothetical protein
MVKPKGRAPAMFGDKDHIEQFQFYFRQHWIRMLWPILTMMSGTLIVLAVGITVFGFVTLPNEIVRRICLLFLTAFLLGLHFQFVARFYRHFLYIIVVTDRRIHRIKKQLLSLDDHQCIDLGSLQEIQKRQHGIVQNMLGFGSLILEAQETELKIHFVPRISHQYATIMHIQAELAARAQRGTVGPPGSKVGSEW